MLPAGKKWLFLHNCGIQEIWTEQEICHWSTLGKLEICLQLLSIGMKHFLLFIYFHNISYTVLVVLTVVSQLFLC